MAITTATSDLEAEAIRKTVFNYIESCYSWEGSRMKRALHPRLVKRMVWTDPKTGRTKMYELSALKLIRDTQGGWGDRKARVKRTPVAQRQEDMTILDRYKDMAIVRTEASRGIDYIGLAKFNGKWKIINVLWRERDDTTGHLFAKNASEVVNS